MNQQCSRCLSTTFPLNVPGVPSSGCHFCLPLDVHQKSFHGVGRHVKVYTAPKPEKLGEERDKR